MNTKVVSLSPVLHSITTQTRVLLLASGIAAMLTSGVSKADLLALDDGSVDFHGGTANGDLLALNHFNVGGASVVIDEIRVLWNPLSSSVHPTVTLYSDPDGDGKPWDMTPILIQPLTIQPFVVILGNVTPRSYSISPTVVTGSFFVGAFPLGPRMGFRPGHRC